MKRSSRTISLLMVLLVLFIAPVYAKEADYNCALWQQQVAEAAVHDTNPPARGDYIMVVHGGAGTLLREAMTPKQEAAYTAGLRAALEAGYRLLKAGKPALDAVEGAIRLLEDNPLFNAGKGAVFTHDGRNELDAAIMDGKTKAAGAVAGVTTIRNPITAARAVMERSEHVFLVGPGAEKFAEEMKLDLVPPAYFRTPERWEGLQRALKKESTSEAPAPTSKAGVRAEQAINNDQKFGTVGAVALDLAGNLAAGTSTGGMTNKKYGRVGDAPIIGAGTYADNATVAVSATGWGEFYIRNVVAHDLAAMMEYGGRTVEEAGDAVIGKVAKMGGDGGLVALDKHGHMAMPFNTSGMYRGTLTSDGKIDIRIFK